MQIYILIPALLLLAGLIYFEKTNQRTGKLVCKPLLSLLFILFALLNPWPDPNFGKWVLAGLMASWVGDVCLIFESRPVFLAGLVAFLMGHLFYIGGFYTTAAMSVWTWAGLGIVTLVGVPVWKWLAPHLQGMVKPVLAYVIVISLMVGGAFSIFGDLRFNSEGRHLVFWGALVFYVSDLFVARQRFVAPGFVNRALGLPLYYTGQFALAGATAWISVGT